MKAEERFIQLLNMALFFGPERAQRPTGSRVTAPGLVATSKFLNRIILDFQIPPPKSS